MTTGGTGYNWPMRFRLGLTVGLGAGYYLGAKAGRERYEQMNQMLRKVRRTDAYQTASDKAQAAMDLGVERAKDFVEEHKPGSDNGGQPRTLEEVGKEFGVTRERIRQIESKTLAKLRHPQRSQKLRDYLDSE